MLSLLGCRMGLRCNEVRASADHRCRPALTPPPPLRLAGQHQELAEQTDIHGHSAHWGTASQLSHLAEAGIL